MKSKTQILFLAGAGGVIGRALLPLLRRAGYTVYGSTRRPERAAWLQTRGVRPVLVDVYEGVALKQALQTIAPDAVIHQLSDLPAGLDPEQMAQARLRNARMREEGTARLLEASLAAGCTRLIAQSIAWAYAPGPQPLGENQPLDLQAPGERGITVRGVAALEQQLLQPPGLQAAVLRYGQLYGPGTGQARPAAALALHVHAAAWAALLALQKSATGAFNIVEDQAEVSNRRARHELSWHPELRLPADAEEELV